MRILIINGPNLNRLGTREPGIYGTKTMAQILLELQKCYPSVYFTYYQSNHEGDLIDRIQAADGIACEKEKADGIILNAGGYAHTSVSLRDAIADCPVPVVDIHISDINRREPFRRTELLQDVCAHTIIGQGTNGYKAGAEWLMTRIGAEQQ